MTQMARARRGEISHEAEAAAKTEGVAAEAIAERIAEGTVVLPCNRKAPRLRACAIGKGLRTKINANIGTSSDDAVPEAEFAKLDVAVAAGTDAIMDLSTGGDVNGVRQSILSRSAVPVGTVPIYQAVVDVVRGGRPMVQMTEDELFGAIERHAQDGVDFATVHCGVTREVVDRLRTEGRVTDVVSRGGSLLIEWMLYNDKENPLYEHYDRLLEIAREYDVTLSLGDGFRPGSLADATDRAQIQELLVIGELVDKARAAGVQTMVEGPGHVPLNQIESNVMLEKEMCKGAPFYVLGPLVTDVSPGYDHITAAIGGAVAAAAGADFLCYVTPSEHLRLPTVEDVREGVVALRIAAHAGDIAKGVTGAADWDLRMSQARKALDWPKMLELSIDPEKAKRLRAASHPKDDRLCTMCGELCAMKKMDEAFRRTTRQLLGAR